MNKSKEIVIMALIILIIFIVMEDKYTDKINYLTKHIVEVSKDNFALGYFLTLLCTLPFNYLMVPGMNLIVIVGAYFIESFWISFFFMLSVVLFWVLASWCTYDYIFVPYFKKSLKKDKIYKVLKIW